MIDDLLIPQFTYVLRCFTYPVQSIVVGCAWLKFTNEWCNYTKCWGSVLRSRKVHIQITRREKERVCVCHGRHISAVEFRPMSTWYYPRMPHQKKIITYVGIKCECCQLPPFQHSKMPPSGSTLLLLENFDLIGSTTIFGALYGITFVLYCLCAQSLYLRLQEPDKRRQTLFNLSNITLLLLCATVHLALNTWMMQLAYVDNSDFPGGPLAYEVLYKPTQNFLLTTNGFLEITIEVLTSAIQVSY